MVTRQHETTDAERLTKMHIGHLYIREGDVGTVVRGLDVGDYKTSDPRVIRLFRDFFARRGDWYPSRGDFLPTNIVFVATDGEELALSAVPDYLEENGPRYLTALSALSEDLARQYARTAKKLQPMSTAIRKVTYHILGGDSGFPPRPILKPSDVPDALKALSRLDRRAFVFGVQSVSVVIGFEHTDGKKTAFRLRPPIFKDARAASRMTNPPLPQPLWSWIYGKPQA